MDPNFIKLNILSIAFLLLFSAFNTAQNLASSVLKNLGFDNLGFISLALLYLTFAICSFLSSKVVNSWGERISMFVGSACYTLYIASFLLPSASVRYPDSSLFLLNSTFIKVVINLAAIINGFGAGVLWVAQGKYISRIANDSNKGMYNSYFWSMFMAS